MKIQALLLAFCVFFACVSAEEAVTQEVTIQAPEAIKTTFEEDHPDVEAWANRLVATVEEAISRIEATENNLLQTVVYTLIDLDVFFTELRDFVVNNKERIQGDLAAQLTFVIEQFILLIEGVFDPESLEDVLVSIDEQFFAELYGAHLFLVEAFGSIAESDAELAQELQRFANWHQTILDNLVAQVERAVHDVVVSVIQLDSVYMEVRGVVIAHLNYWLSTKDTVALYSGLKDIVPAEKLNEFTNAAKNLMKI